MCFKYVWRIQLRLILLSFTIITCAQTTVMNDATLRVFLCNIRKSSGKVKSTTFSAFQNRAVIQYLQKSHLHKGLVHKLYPKSIENPKKSMRHFAVWVWSGNPEDQRVTRHKVYGPPAENYVI